jgi:hypothetical protein
LTNAAANLDLTGFEDDGGGGDLPNDEPAYGVTLSKRQDFVRSLESNLGRATGRIGMPGGADDRQFWKVGTIRELVLTSAGGQ